MEELKPYPKYKDSGVDWIGEIPKHWSIKPLFTAINEVKNKNRELKITNVLSLSYGKIVKRDVETNHGLLPVNFKNYNIINNGNIVMRLTDLQNDKKSLRVGYVKEKGIITSAYVTLSLKKNQDCYSKYLYYLLHTYDLQKIYYGLGDGVRQTMNFNDLKWLPIIDYYNEETKRITKFLDAKVTKINSLIVDKQSLIELLEEKRQAIITETVTKGLDPNVKMKDSGIEWIGEIPEHWEVTRIKYHSEINNRSLSKNTNPNKQITYIDIGGVDSNGNIIEKEVYRFKNAPSRARRIVKNGDTIVSTVRTYLQAITIIDEKSDGNIVSTGFAVLTPQNSVVDDYFGLYFRSMPVLDRIVSLSKGINYPAINTVDLAQLHFVFPPYEEQKEIVLEIDNKLNLIEETILKINHQITKLEEYRDSLIYEAVTGKIDLRDYEVDSSEHNTYEKVAESKEAYHN